MRDSIVIIIIVGILILATQVTALFAQYRVNKFYKGVNKWLIGSSLIMFSFMLMPLVTVDSIKYLAVLSNPLLILGHLFLYIGIKDFLSKKVNKAIPIGVFLIFNLFYFYFLFINNIIVARTIGISTALVLISFLIVYELLLAKDIMLAASRYFNAAIFFIYGSVNVVRIILTVFSNQENSYIGQSFTIISSTIFAIVISNLWIFGLIIMVNQRLDNENELEKEKLQLIFNTSTNAQSITRMQDSFILDVNDEFAELTGYSKHEVIGKTTKEMGFWTNSKDRDIFVTQLNAQGICKSMESVFKRKDDTYFDGIISARTIRIHGETHIISVVRDETERKRFENAILESEEKYRSILNASPDDITITNFSGDILMVSPAAKEMFGYDHGFEGFIGMKLLDFLVPEDVERAKANILGMNNGNTGNTNEYRAVRQDKSIIDIEVNSGLIYNAQGIPDKIVFIIRDISARKAIELQLGKVVKQLEIEKNIAQRNAITDSLTGLYNRGYFDNKLRTEFSELSNSGLSLSLIMLDIDYFKKFNDNYGHLAGDKCIQMVTTMLKNKIEGTHDIVARYGGEEFIVILPGTGENEAKIIGEEVRQAVEDLDIPHMASNTVNHVTVSVGIVTVYPEDLASPDDALKMVDDTLYQAKENGRNCCVFNSVREQDVALA